MNNDASDNAQPEAVPPASSSQAFQTARTAHSEPTARPISPAARITLLARACAMVALCYLFSLVAIIVLSAILPFEFLIFIVMMRVGIIGPITRAMERHVGLIKLFARSLWLKTRHRTRVKLTREEAPHLFEILDSLAQRLRIKVPREVVVDTSANAWLELRGFGRGARSTRLGIGYDLVAGLTEDEVGAVLAHEMVHARLVRQGFYRWLDRGVRRIANLSSKLSAQQESYRRAKKTFFGGEVCLFFADWCTRSAARLVAASSQQDEFDADIGAAQLCGSAAMRSALEKLEHIGDRTSRLSWPERVAKLQSGDGYAAWLIAEITTTASATAISPKSKITDPYSTHPSFADRITALPTTSKPARVSPSAMGLILEPDALADRIVKEFELRNAHSEAIDERQLRKISKQFRGGMFLQPGQLLGVLIFISGIIAIFMAFAETFTVTPLIIGVGGMAGGIWLFRTYQQIQTLSLPIPDYDQIIDKATELKERTDLREADKLLEKRYKEAAANPAPKRTAIRYFRTALTALADCDYLEVHAATRQGLKTEEGNAACILLHCISTAALGRHDFLFQNMWIVDDKMGIRNFDTLWGLAWSFFLCGHWDSAEALLVELLKLRSDEVTFLLLRSHCAERRGKQQTALAHARMAVEIAPLNSTAQRILLSQLVANGYVREASARLASIPLEIREAKDLRLARIRLEMLLGDFAAVKSIEATVLTDQLHDAHVRMELAVSHESIRSHDRAWELYEEVTQLGHYPQALIGLGRISRIKGRHDEARQRLLLALNTKPTLAPKALPPLHFFSTVMEELRSLRGPEIGLRAWTLTFADCDAAGALAKQSFVIFARDEKSAILDMKTVTDALMPDNKIETADVDLHLAPNDRQPIGAATAGVQGVWR